MTPRRSDSLQSAVTLGAVLLLGAVFLWEVLSLTGIPIARDMQLFFIPQRRLLWASLQSGSLPLWTPYLGHGTPLFANFQSGALYPPNWLYAIAPFYGTFNSLLVFHFLLGGAFMFLFGRAIDLSRSSAVAASIAYMLGGYFVSLTNLLNVLQAAAWAPAIGWAIVRHATIRSATSFAILVGVLWLAFIAGEPLTFALAVALTGVHAGLWCWRRGSWRAVAALAASVTLAGVLLAGLSALQLLPTAEFVAQSDRGGGLSYLEAERYHLEAIRLMHLVIPPEYGDPVYRFGRKALLVTVEPWLFSIYVGAVLILLMAGARLDRERRLESLYWAIAGLLGLVISLGDATPVYGVLYRHLPGFSSFRFPERLLFITGFSTAVLGGMGLSAIRSVRRPVRLDGALGAGFLVLLLGARVAWSVYADRLREWGEVRMPDAPFFQYFDFAHPLWAENLERVIVLVGIGLLLIALYRRGVFRQSLVVAGLIGVLTLDLWTAHRQLTPVADRSFYEDPPVVAGLIPFADLRTDYRYRASPFDEDITRFHTLPGLSLESEKWMWQQTVQPNLGAFHSLLTHGSGDAIHLTRDVDRSTFLAMLPDESRWRVLRLASVRWIYSFRGFDPDLYASRARLDSLPGFIYEMRDPLPRAYIVHDPIVVDEEIDAFNASITRQFDPHRQVALLSAEVREEHVDGLPREASSSARILADTGQEVRVSVSPAGAGYLVLTDSHYPGWSAYVDGEERPILLANYFYRAVAVRPGDREVVFAYHSRPFELGRRISSLTLLISVAGFALAGLVRRRHRPVRHEGV